MQCATIELLSQKLFARFVPTMINLPVLLGRYARPVPTLDAPTAASGRNTSRWAPQTPPPATRWNRFRVFRSGSVCCSARLSAGSQNQHPSWIDSTSPGRRRRRTEQHRAHDASGDLIEFYSIRARRHRRPQSARRRAERRRGERAGSALSTALSEQLALAFRNSDAREDSVTEHLEADGGQFTRRVHDTPEPTLEGLVRAANTDSEPGLLYLYCQHSAPQRHRRLFVGRPCDRSRATDRLCQGRVVLVRPRVRM